MKNQNVVYEAWQGEKLVSSANTLEALLPMMLTGFQATSNMEFIIKQRQDNAQWDCTEYALTWKGETIIHLVNFISVTSEQDLCSILNGANAYPAGDEFS